MGCMMNLLPMRIKPIEAASGISYLTSIAEYETEKDEGNGAKPCVWCISSAATHIDMVQTVISKFLGERSLEYPVVFDAGQITATRSGPDVELDQRSLDVRDQPKNGTYAKIIPPGASLGVDGDAMTGSLGLYVPDVFLL